MHLKVEKSFLTDLKNNTFLMKKGKEFINLKPEEMDKFMQENPDFVQMMMHLAGSEKIKVEYD